MITHIISARKAPPSTFDKTVDHPNYHTEMLSYNLNHLLQGMGSAGLSFRQVEQGDITAIEDSFDGYMSTFESWLNSAVHVQNTGAGSVSAVPALPDVISGLPAIISGSTVLTILAKIAVHLILKKMEKTFNPNTETKELTHAIKQCFYSDGVNKAKLDVFQEWFELLAKSLIDSGGWPVPGAPVNGLLKAITDLTQNQFESIIEALGEIKAQFLFEGDVVEEMSIATIIANSLLDTGEEKDYNSLVEYLAHTPIRIVVSNHHDYDDVTFE